eukprot:10501626-Lingulodinium_polyedra.AAC.1
MIFACQGHLVEPCEQLLQQAHAGIMLRPRNLVRGLSLGPHARLKRVPLLQRCLLEVFQLGLHSRRHAAAQVSSHMLWP